MPITITLNPEEEDNLRGQAAAAGLAAEEYAANLLRNTLDLTPRGPRISARGKYAHSPRSSEDFMRERREENAKEEARWAEQYGSRK